MTIISQIKDKFKVNFIFIMSNVLNFIFIFKGISSFHFKEMEKFP